MPPRSKPGRPTEANTRHIAQVALRLFEQKGFEAVTMEEVAKAASVSRRTLFRHFPSKADLVWAGTDEVLGVLKSLAAPLEGRKLMLRSVVSELFVPVLAMLDEPTQAELARRRLKLISGVPTLLNHPMLREVEALLASLIAANALPKSASAPLVARTLVAAAFTALQWWAEHGEGQRASETTLGALQAIASAMER
jgi:AcrR family transcriptional regulator